MKRSWTILATIGLGLAIGLALAAAWGWSRAPEAALVKVEVGRRQAAVGEPLPAIITVRIPWRTSLFRVSTSAPPVNLQLVRLDSQPGRWHWGARDCRIEAVFQGLAAGPADLPAVLCHTSSGTLEIPLSTIVEITPAELLGPDPIPAPPWAPPAAPLPWWAYAVGGLALLLIAAGVVARVRLPPPLEPPPGELAARALTSLTADTEPGACCQQLSDIVRAYVQAAWQVPAANRTTTEFLETIAAGEGRLTPELRDLLTRLLTSADRIKFAAVRATAAELQEVLNDAVRFVQASEDLLHPETEHTGME